MDQQRIKTQKRDNEVKIEANAVPANVEDSRASFVPSRMLENAHVKQLRESELQHLNR